MKLGPSVDRQALRGTAAIQLWDAVSGRPVDVPCEVAALLGVQQVPVARARRHRSAGLQGFLELAPGNYRLRMVPSTQEFIPSLRSVQVLGGDQPVLWVDAPLRPGPTYSNVPAGMAVVRGTVQWGTLPGAPVAAPLPPGRWVLVSASREKAPRGGGVLSTAWTRANARGDFVLMLAMPGPDSDGKRPQLKAVVKLHGTPPAPGAPRLADDDYTDLVLDDGSDADVLARQPVLRTLTLLDVLVGQERTLNMDTYSVTPPGSARTQKQTVILLS
jgi:hypothetical protein